jgi:hypothetical protein
MLSRLFRRRRRISDDDITQRSVRLDLDTLGKLSELREIVDPQQFDVKHPSLENAITRGSTQWYDKGCTARGLATYTLETSDFGTVKLVKPRADKDNLISQAVRNGVRVYWIRQVRKDGSDAGFLSFVAAKLPNQEPRLYARDALQLELAKVLRLPS